MITRCLPEVDGGCGRVFSCTFDGNKKNCSSCCVGLPNKNCNIKRHDKDVSSALCISCLKKQLKVLHLKKIGSMNTC